MKTCARCRCQFEPQSAWHTLCPACWLAVRAENPEASRCHGERTPFRDHLQPIHQASATIASTGIPISPNQVDQHADNRYTQGERSCNPREHGR